MIYFDGEPIEDLKRKYEEGLRKISGTTNLEDVKPIGLYENSDEVLRTLEKLYNDYLVRPDECKALDWAIRFIKAHTKTGLEKMIADCERHIVCKGCQHEKECE